MAQREPALVTPFWVRIATETSLSPGWLLIAFPAVLYPAYLALEVLFGRGLAAATDFTADWEARHQPVNTVLFGCIAMVGVYVARGTFGDLEALRSVLRGDEAAYAALRRQLTQFERRRLWIGASAGVAFGSLVQELVDGRWTSLLAGDWSLREASIVVTALAYWLVFGMGTVYVIDSARLYSRIGERHVAVDLLNLAPLSPLTHHGLRVVLSMVVITLPWAVITAIDLAPSDRSNSNVSAFG